MDDQGYKILEAVYFLSRELNNAPEKVLEEVYQRVVHATNASFYGQEVEPLQGICVAFQAAFKRRTL